MLYMARTDGAEVLLQAVPDKFAAPIDEIAQLQIGLFERDDVVRGLGGVEITGEYARELREIVLRVTSVSG